MLTIGSEIIEKLHLMQGELEAMTSQVESIVQDKMATERAVAIYKANEEHHEHMMACRDASIEALKAVVYNKSSHHAKLAALVKGNLTEDQIKSYKAKSHTEAQRMHQATTDKNNELYAKQQKTEKATIQLHNKKILSIKERFKTTAKGVTANKNGPKPSIAKKTKDGQPKAVKKSLPTTPRCRFISAMTAKWREERSVAVADGDTEFPNIFVWVKPLWQALAAADRQPYLDAFKVDVEDKKATELKGEVWVNPNKEAKKQKVENGAASKVAKKGPKADSKAGSKADSKADSKKDAKKDSKKDTDTDEEADADAAKTDEEADADAEKTDAESGGEDDDDDDDDEPASGDDDDDDGDDDGDDDAAASGDDDDKEEGDDDDAKASGSDSD